MGLFFFLNDESWILNILLVHKILSTAEVFTILNFKSGAEMTQFFHFKSAAERRSPPLSAQQWHFGIFCKFC